jgi:hypothetical protein
MAPAHFDPGLDRRFFRVTGAVLVVATLFAGGMTLLLAADESRAMRIAQDALTKAPIQITASSIP